MPEINHEFTAGKMNKDLDERLVPAGEYRDAMNIQVRTTDGSDSGTVQNLRGNSLKGFVNYQTGYTSFANASFSNSSKVVASIASEKNNKAYFFHAAPPLSSVFSDVTVINSKKTWIDNIVEVSSDGTSIEPVVTDVFAITTTRDELFGGPSFNPVDQGYQFPFQEFKVVDGENIRPGMSVKIYNSNGQNLVSNSCEIQNVLYSNGVYKLKLYDQENGINWNGVDYIIFTAERVLNFDNKARANYITGINIIDDLLFWTDNKSEPKKINITRCRQGTSSLTSHTKNIIYNQLDEGSLFTSLEDQLTPLVNDFLKEEDITVIKKAPKTAPSLEMATTSRINADGTQNTTVTGVYFNFAAPTSASEADEVIMPYPGYDISINSDLFNGVNYQVNDILNFTEEIQGVSGTVSCNVNSINTNTNGTVTLNLTITSVVGNVVFPSADIIGSGYWTTELDQNKPLFELKFGRFGYRYKYTDGEYSSFSPWSELAFLPGRFDYNHKKGYNLGMTNNVRELIIRDFIPHQRTRPNDVVEIDILYKTSVSPNIYVVKTITREKDPEWDLFTPGGQPNATDMVFGELKLTSEMIHKVLPENQLLRAWDNVPRYALAQEITANRLIYGNYTQGYNIEQQVGLIQSLKHQTTATLSTPQKSIKSLREYKFGMVFGDKYGRETPVISPGYISGNNVTNFSMLSGDVGVEKEFSKFKNTFELTQNWDNPLAGTGEPEEWMSYVKYYVKETSSEYYNLVMDRWYYAEDGNAWISFPSADRNKVDEETYLILKNQHGNNNPVDELGRFKIIAIEADAPEFIKRDPRPLGSCYVGNANVYGGVAFYIFSDTSPNTNVNTPNLLMGNNKEIVIDNGDWDNFIDEDYTLGGAKGELMVRVIGENGDGGIKIFGKKWNKVTYISQNDSGDCKIRWKDPFLEDADMQEKFTSSGITLTDLRYHLDFKEEVIENKAEFDGKFFVKLERNGVLQQHVLKSAAGNIDYDNAISYPIGYIDNQPINPGINGPRSNYQWLGLTTPAGVFSGESNIGGNDAQVIPGTQGVDYVQAFNDGQDNATLANVAMKGSSNEGYWSYIPQNVLLWQGNNAAAALEITQYYQGNNNLRAFMSTFLGMGCWPANSNWNKQKGNYYNFFGETSFSGGSNVNNINPDDFDTGGPYNVINAAWDSFSFWKYIAAVAETSDEGANYRLFIDSARGKRTRMWGGPNDGSSSIDDGWESNSMTYYKPTGLDRGYLNDSTIGVVPTSSTHFGRMHIGVIRPEAEYPFGSGDEAGFKNAFTKPGTLFRFQKDPNERIYQVVTPEGFHEDSLTWNYSAYPEEGDDGCNNGGAGHHVGNSELGQVLNNSISTNGASINGYYIGGQEFSGVDTSCDVCRSKVSYYGVTEGLSTCNPGDVLNVNHKRNCHRYGFRFEFRRFDTGTGALMDNGNIGLDPDEWDPRGQICHDGREAMGINIVEPAATDPSIVIPVANAAIWETEPKENTALDIYYEASSAIPMVLTSENTTQFAPYNAKITARSLDLNSAFQFIPLSGQDHHVWTIGYTSKTSIIGIKYTPTLGGDTERFASSEISVGDFLVFEHKDGTKTMSKVTRYMEPVDTPFDDDDINFEEQRFRPLAGENSSSQINFSLQYIGPDNQCLLDNNSGSLVPGMIPQSISEGLIPSGVFIESVNANIVILNDTSWMANDADGIPLTYKLFSFGTNASCFYEIESEVYKYPVELSWHNCWSYGNGLETDRIRDDFNAPQLDNGVKVSTTLIDYGKEVKGSSMIYSGLYNSTSGVNDLNEFNMAEKITKDLNPTYGSIQRLHTQDNDVVIFAEDRVLQVTTNKDALFNADGNPQLMASNKVLGTASPFAGRYGISKNPESLAWDQYRLYFTDMQRGAVLRLSNNGITPISNVGMKTFFRDNLKKTKSLVGSFDTVLGEYNLTLKYQPASNAPSRSNTAAFNEGSKGWVSFRSFVPQQGLSVGGKYMTAYRDAGIYTHHDEEVDRNTFYGTFTPSYVDVVFNEQPGVIKGFQTINYEGSQSKVIQLQTEDAFVGIGGVSGTDQFSEFNDGEYYNYSEKFGWYVESIDTDKQSGHVPEFIEKEGKWFNKISGIEKDGFTSPDLASITVQGLGNVKEVSSGSDGDVSADGTTTLYVTGDMINDTTD